MSQNAPFRELQANSPVAAIAAAEQLASVFVLLYQESKYFCTSQHCLQSRKYPLMPRNYFFQMPLLEGLKHRAAQLEQRKDAFSIRLQYHSHLGHTHGTPPFASMKKIGQTCSRATCVSIRTFVLVSMEKIGQNCSPIHKVTLPRSRYKNIYF